MRFAVMVTYLLSVYTYDITSEDGKHFTCTRRAVEPDESNAPPEELLLTLGEEPKTEFWGKSLAGLYRQLTKKINEKLLQK